MTDQEVLREIEELERWSRSFPQPKMSAEPLAVLKLVVAGALGAGDPGAHASVDLRQRIKVKVREALRRPSRRPVPILGRLSPWLSSAAALVFVIAGYGLLSRSPQSVSREMPTVWEPPFALELASIEADLVDLELQSLASDLLLIGADEIDGDLYDRIERLLVPNLFLDETDEPHQEGVMR